jgi:hypothetical protein
MFQRALVFQTSLDHYRNDIDFAVCVQPGFYPRDQARIGQINQITEPGPGALVKILRQCPRIGDKAVFAHAGKPTPGQIIALQYLHTIIPRRRNSLAARRVSD